MSDEREIPTPTATPPTPPPPSPLNYQPANAPRPTAPHPFAQFSAGVVLALALVAAGIGMANTRPASPVPVVLAIAAEFLAGLFVTVLSSRYRPFGIGLIAAIPVGLMLFFVGCALLIAFR